MELVREVSGFYLSIQYEVREIVKSVPKAEYVSIETRVDHELLIKFAYFHVFHYLDAIVSEIRLHGRHLVQCICQR